MDKIKIEIKKCVFTRNGKVVGNTLLGLLKKNNEEIIDSCYSDDVEHIFNYFLIKIKKDKKNESEIFELSDDIEKINILLNQSIEKLKEKVKNLEQSIKTKKTQEEYCEISGVKLY